MFFFLHGLHYNLHPLPKNGRSVHRHLHIRPATRVRQAHPTARPRKNRHHQRSARPRVPRSLSQQHARPIRTARPSHGRHQRFLPRRLPKHRTQRRPPHLTPRDRTPRRHTSPARNLPVLQTLLARRVGPTRRRRRTNVRRSRRTTVVARLHGLCLKIKYTGVETRSGHHQPALSKNGQGKLRRTTKTEKPFSIRSNQKQCDTSRASHHDCHNTCRVQTEIRRRVIRRRRHSQRCGWCGCPGFAC